MIFRPLIVAAFIASPAAAQNVISAAVYGDETTRYAHGILGDAIEYGSLSLTVDGAVIKIELPENRVFEDLAPRIADIDGDGDVEVIAIESDVNLGAQLAIYDESGKIASTPFLGQSHRWLAPIGIADFDGDGQMDVAYIEKPHLAKILKVWTMRDGELSQIAEASGLTNHRIGEDFISGGVRTCAGATEMVTADANWRVIVATKLVNGKPEFTTVGPFNGQQSFQDALNCR